MLTLYLHKYSFLKSANSNSQQFYGLQTPVYDSHILKSSKNHGDLAAILDDVKIQMCLSVFLPGAAELGWLSSTERMSLRARASTQQLSSGAEQSFKTIEHSF